MCEHHSGEGVLYLPSLHRGGIMGLASSLKPHRWCAGCGLISVEGESRGRKASYFIGFLGTIQEALRRRKHLGFRPLSQTEYRLLVRRIATDEVFSDPWGSHFDCQLRRFMELVQERRKEASWDSLDIRPG